MEPTLMAISKEQLTNFKDYRQKGDIIANRIFEKLRASSKYRVSRVKIAGSIGKRTALGAGTQPDFDLVVFVNNETPPFEFVIEEFKSIFFPPHSVLYGHNSNEFIFSGTTGHCLKLGVKNADGSFYSFDVSPAANLLSPEHYSISGSSATEREKIQTQRVLKLISENPAKQSSYYGSSLAEKTIEFVEKQSAFVHDVIRLGKLWNSKVDDLPYLYGRSMMIELVALWVGRKEEGSGRVLSISSAFQAFLRKFTNFDQNMDVFFDYPVNPNMNSVHQQYLLHIKKRPVILDPVNPYNNFAVNLTPAMKSTFHAKATEFLIYIQNNNISAVKRFFEAS